MIVLPPGFVKTRYPGYFWSIPEQRLYTAKGGVLKKMKMHKGYRHIPPGYKVSHDGLPRKYTLNYLKGLKYPSTVDVFPMEQN